MTKQFCKKECDLCFKKKRRLWKYKNGFYCHHCYQNKVKIWVTPRGYNLNLRNVYEKI